MAHEIVVGVSGGIAAYKTAALVSDLVQSGVGTTVVMTRAATKFVGTATFRALTGRRVYSRVFDGHEMPLGPHIELARQSDLLCVAPATANFMAQAAHGLADDLLSTLLLSFTGPVVVAPAMNNEMWEKPAVQRNMNFKIFESLQALLDELYPGIELVHPGRVRGLAGNQDKFGGFGCEKGCREES